MVELRHCNEKSLQRESELMTWMHNTSEQVNVNCSNMVHTNTEPNALSVRGATPCEATLVWKRSTREVSGIHVHNPLEDELSFEST